MKRYIFLSGFFTAFVFVHAQVVPNTSNGPSSVTGVNPVPSAYNSNMLVNYIRSWDATRPFTTDTSVVSSNRTVQEVRQSTQYFDGLGRPFQTVLKQISPLGKDVVSPAIYDSFGREVFKYLPYVVIDSNSTNGKFKRNPFNEQANFYSNSTYNPGLTGEQVYYNRTVFESSPLNKIDTTFAPGNSWGGNHTGNIKQSLINVAADSVRIWNISSTSGVTPTSSSYYAKGLLYKNLTKDEHGKQVIEYKDKDGKVVLKKVQVDTSPSTHHIGWLCTYFIYDELNNLRFVIQPKGVDTLKILGWQFENSILSSSTIAKELCFSYEYDGKARLIIKRIPGVDEVWRVYDARDRLIMAQDSVLRLSGKWLYTQYDLLNRPILSGLWTNSSNRSYHEAQAANGINYPNPSSNYEVLTQTYFDDYSWVSGTGLSNTFITTYATNTNYFYTPSNTTFPYPQSITPTYITMGMATGSKIKVLGTTSTYLYTVTFYDDQRRIIQTHATNYSGGKDTVTMQYSFEGRLLRSLVCHDKSGTNAQKYKVFTKNEFDAAGRLTKTSKKLANSPEVVLTENTYDELGQLQKKKIGQKRDETNQNIYTSSAIDSLQYTYNIRGWLRGINKDYARGTNSNNWFGMELTYDFGFSQTQLNGNIAGIRWRNKSDGEQRAYGFTYDAVNRFTKADFTQYTSTSWNTSAGVDYTVKDMSYDANGNILTMTQKGLKMITSSVIDSLVYGYISGTNKLNYVTDKTNDTTTLLGDFKEYINNTSQDYNYDGNGNMYIDNNKKISSILYNHLNLADSIRILGKGTIKYIYDAAGNKLAKRTIDSTAGINTSTTMYLNGFEYKNDTLQFLCTEEGRVRSKPSTNNDTMYYDYFEKDHLGNVRVMLTDELKTDAYPPASMETAKAATEESLYGLIAETRHVLPSGYPTDTYTNPNDYVAMVRSYFEDFDVGPNILLKVMTGDKFNIRVSSWWDADKNTTPGTPSTAINNVIAYMATGMAAKTNKFGTGYNITENALLNTGVSDYLSTQSGYDSDKPKAFINWILVDEQLRFVSGGSGFEQVGDDEDFTVHIRNDLSVEKSGYLFVYVSNETSNIPVFFDNLQVTHIRGPLLTVENYYPFGLIQDGLSSKALAYGNPQNKNLYNSKELQSKEFSDGGGLEMYDYGARMYDMQIGRWLVIDNKAEKYQNMTPYAYASDNPIFYVDPNGEENIPALIWAYQNLFGVQWKKDGTGTGIGWYTNNKFQFGVIPRYGVCYDLCWTSYLNTSQKQLDYFRNSGFLNPSNNFVGRIADKAWFIAGDGSDRKFETNIAKGELGDIVFMGEDKSMQGHAVLLSEIPKIETNSIGDRYVRLKTLSTNASIDQESGLSEFGDRDFHFFEQKDGTWMWTSQDGKTKYTFKGYGQLVNTPATTYSNIGTTAGQTIALLYARQQALMLKLQRKRQERDSASTPN